jgi:hypothetical protein
MEAALHQQLRLAGADDLDRFVSCSLTVWHINHFETFDADAERFREVDNLILGSDGDWNNQTRFSGFERAAQGTFIARMSDGLSKAAADVSPLLPAAHISHACVFRRRLIWPLRSSFKSAYDPR